MIKRIAEIVKASPPETTYRNKLSRIYLHPRVSRGRSSVDLRELASGARLSFLSLARSTADTYLSTHSATLSAITFLYRLLTEGGGR